MQPNEGESMDWGRIKLLLLDSDGVLTDGGVYLPESEGPEIRRFDIKDGFGITRLLGEGFPIGVISRSPSTPVRVRCERLGIPHIFLGAKDKVDCAKQILNQLNLDWSDMAFMGDDVPDLPLLEKVGFSLTPQNGAFEVREKVMWVSQFPGGGGAVREACDKIYNARET
jgi:3-deoxy-D-manno-octulosonate 8-phosphate phosphatase (KDO 8-P phosphatase)